MDNFLSVIMNYNKRVKQRNSIVFRKICFDLYAEIVKRTPVDTGLARGNWRIGVGEAPQGTIDRKNKSGSRSGEELAKVPDEVNNQTVVFIANNLVYIVPLEHGWSKQAPNGMVSGSIQDIMAAAAGAMR